MNTCLFCKIADKLESASILYEDDDILVFMEICPIREGHLQIIPKTHYETFEELPSELASKIMITAQKFAKRLKEVYAVNRVAFLYSGGDIPHAHAHVFPMVEKADITSERYIVQPKQLEFESAHLRRDMAELNQVRDLLLAELDI